MTPPEVIVLPEWAGIAFGAFSFLGMFFAVAYAVYVFVRRFMGIRSFFGGRRG